MTPLRVHLLFTTPNSTEFSFIEVPYSISDTLQTIAGKLHCLPGDLSVYDFEVHHRYSIPDPNATLSCYPLFFGQNSPQAFVASLPDRPSIPNSPLMLGDLIYSHQFSCGNCDTCCHSGQIKYSSLNPRPLLIFALGRFSNFKHDHGMSYAKIQTRVEYPEWFTVSITPGNFAQYRLVGVILHHGATLTAGHYTAYVRSRSLDESQVFFECNDSYVRKATVAEVLNNPEAYILWYRREAGISQAVMPDIPQFTFAAEPFVDKLTPILDTNDPLRQELEKQSQRILCKYRDSLGVADQNIAIDPAPPLSSGHERNAPPIPEETLSSLDALHHVTTGTHISPGTITESFPSAESQAAASASTSSKHDVTQPNKPKNSERNHNIAPIPVGSVPQAQMKAGRSTSRQTRQQISPSPLAKSDVMEESSLSSEVDIYSYLADAVMRYKAHFSSSSDAAETGDHTILIDFGAACSTRSNPRYFGTVAFAATDVLTNEKKNEKDAAKGFGYLSRYDIISFIKLLGYLACSNERRQELSRKLDGHKSFDRLISDSISVWRDYLIESRIDLFGIPTLLALPGLILFPYTSDVFKTIPTDLVFPIKPLISSPLSLLILTLDVVTGSPLPPYSCDTTDFTLEIPNPRCPSSWSMHSSCVPFHNLFYTLRTQMEKSFFYKPHDILVFLNQAVYAVINQEPGSASVADIISKQPTSHNLPAELLVGAYKRCPSRQLVSFCSSFIKGIEDEKNEYIRAFLIAIGKCTPANYPDIPARFIDVLPLLLTQDGPPNLYSLSDYDWTDHKGKENILQKFARYLIRWIRSPKKKVEQQKEEQ